MRKDLVMRLRPARRLDVSLGWILLGAVLAGCLGSRPVGDDEDGGGGSVGAGGSVGRDAGVDGGDATGTGGRGGVTGTGGGGTTGTGAVTGTGGGTAGSGAVTGTGGGGGTGTGGVTGAAGSAGRGGAGGGGTTGTAGIAGSAGRGGSAGSAGSAGSTAGSSGSTGVAGSAGRGGSSGGGGAAGMAPPMIYTVSGMAQNAPTGTMIAATSTTAGASCSINSCQVPQGGTVTLTAPTLTTHVFQGWTGGAGCQSTGPSVTLSNVTGSVSCVANYVVTFVVTVTVSGGPAGTTITPTSPTAGATCTAGSCRVPSGGSVTAVAPTLTNWFFNGWTGAATAATAQVSISNIIANTSLVASYINMRQEPCRNQPPANATTSSSGNVTTTYTTAGGWSTPALCPWICNTDYCSTGTACAVTYSDQISYMTGTASKWYGGDDRAASSRTVGTGQSLTPATTTTMHRFGLHFSGGFTYSTTGLFGTQPNTVRLDVRNTSGTILATYTTSLPANFAGGWVYWTTSATTLTGGTQYIFTSFMTNAFTQPVNTGSSGDANAGYALGGGYSASATSGDLITWSLWGTHSWDFYFRVQQRNPSCN